jgi:UDP-N-acetylglucosamine 2-epimerase (non-hydrolysing)
VDDAGRLKVIVEVLNEISERYSLIFPIHPRTKNRLESFELRLSEKIILTDPLSYLEFESLLSDAAFVLTDSGGVQTESYFFNVPCLTMRENTEWVSTLESGTNFLVGFDLNKIINTLEMLSMYGFRPEKKEIPGWDGRTSERIAQILMDFLSRSLKH